MSDKPQLTLADLANGQCFTLRDPLYANDAFVKTGQCVGGDIFITIDINTGSRFALHADRKIDLYAPAQRNRRA